MTPHREEAARLLRLARRDRAAFIALLDAPGVGLAVALFHAQQAAEKALKAVMCLRGLEFRHRYDDEAPELLSDAEARAIVDSLLAWADTRFDLSGRSS